MKARRAVFESLSWKDCRGAHPGLWLASFLPEQSGDSKEGDGAKAALLAEAAGVPVPGAYKHAFASRRRLFDGEDHTSTVLVETTGRLAIGLGEGGVLETGVRLDHTWGVPVLPGSALKGLATRAADLWLEAPGWRRGRDANAGDGAIKAGESHRTLFGTTDEQGAVIFHDAWLTPDSEGLVPDVMTPHHPKYYQGKRKDTWPVGDESPVPIAFPAVTGHFLLALTGPEEWREAAQEILLWALENLGVGAKTSSGYGRLVELGRKQQQRAAASDRPPEIQHEELWVPSQRVTRKPNDGSLTVTIEGQPYTATGDDARRMYEALPDDLVAHFKRKRKKFATLDVRIRVGKNMLLAIRPPSED